MPGYCALKLITSAWKEFVENYKRNYVRQLFSRSLQIEVMPWQVTQSISSKEADNTRFYFDCHFFWLPYQTTTLLACLAAVSFPFQEEIEHTSEK